MLNRKIYDKSSEWKKGPSINEWPSNDTTHVAFFDENGNSNMIDIINGKNNEENMDNYFSLTCILIDNDKLNAIKTNINNLKGKYWANGIYTYISKDGCKINKKVCFHSREIRKKIGPFSVNEINYDSFMTDLTNFITSQEFIILHCFINKKELLKKYVGLVKDPYEIAIAFIFDVLLGKILKSNDKLECIFESRGKKEDKMLHKFMIDLFQNENYSLKNNAVNIINGIWFNPKRTKENNETYFGLELADLVSYPIFKYCRSMKQDKAYESIKEKIYNYPHNSYGLKLFP